LPGLNAVGLPPQYP